MLSKNVESVFFLDPDKRYLTSSFFIKQLSISHWYSGLRLFEYSLEFAKKFDNFIWKAV
jgi:hypothetical protein